MPKSLLNGLQCIPLNCKLWLFQKLIFKPRSKSNKSSSDGDAAKNKKKKKAKAEKVVEDPKPVERGEESSRSGRVDATDAEAARLSETPRAREVACEEGGEIDGGLEISNETFAKTRGGGETKVGEDDGAEVEVEIARDGEEPKENGEQRAVAAAEMVAVVEAQSETKEEEPAGAEVNGVIENGVEADEGKVEGDGVKREAGGDAALKAGVIAADSQATPTNQSPEEAGE